MNICYVLLKLGHILRLQVGDEIKLVSVNILASFNAQLKGVGLGISEPLLMERVVVITK